MGAVEMMMYDNVTIPQLTQTFPVNGSEIKGNRQYDGIRSLARKCSS